MNIWLRPLMQSERSDEEAVSGRGAASCISVQGLAVCQHRGELLLYPLFYSSIYSQMFFFCFSIPLLSFLSWPVIFLCNLAVSLSQFSAQSFFFIADLRLRYLLCNCQPSQHNVRGHLSVFQKNIEKKLSWRVCEILHSGLWDVCVRVWLHTAGQALMFMHWTTCASRLGTDMGEFSHMYDYEGVQTPFKAADE